MAKNTDWIAVEGAYRSGSGSLREIAANNGITEGAIRARAKKHGWMRDPEGTKREQVKALLSGAAQNATHCALRNIEEAAHQDAADMNMGLSVARRVLASLSALAVTSEEAKDLKVIAETNKIAIETIRRIRGLDEAGAKADITVKWEGTE